MKEIKDEVGAFVPYDPVDVANAGSGPLAGLTFAVKDIFDVAGYPTGCGNPIKRSESPVHRTNAPVVQRMLDPHGHSLLVDGTAVATDEAVVLTPESAVLHRPADHADGPVAGDGCGHDCAPLG